MLWVELEGKAAAAHIEAVEEEDMIAVCKTSSLCLRTVCCSNSCRFKTEGKNWTDLLASFSGSATSSEVSGLFGTSGSDTLFRDKPPIASGDLFSNTSKRTPLFGAKGELSGGLFDKPSNSSSSLGDSRGLDSLFGDKSAASGSLFGDDTTRPGTLFDDMNTGSKSPRKQGGIGSESLFGPPSAGTKKPSR